MEGELNGVAGYKQFLGENGKGGVFMEGRIQEQEEGG